jgi:hypothetical protein
MENTTLEHILLTVMVIAGACTTAFPLLYSRFPWRRTKVGRALMIKASSTAFAVDVTILMNFIRPSVEIRVGVYAFCFSAIAASSLYLTMVMLKTNNPAHHHVVPLDEGAPK